jgi:murein L,D-transpeptidase YcbB/YkuD
LSAVQHHRAVIAAAAALLCIGGLVQRAAAETELQAHLRNRIEAGLSSDSLTVMDEPIYARETIRSVYPERDYAPIWIDARGLNRRGERLLDWLADVIPEHGLHAADYHVNAVEALENADGIGALVDMELALSDAFLLAGSDLLSGRLNAETLGPEWIAMPRRRDLAAVLTDAATRTDPGAVLEGLQPRDPRYRRLADRLAALRRLRDAGGWLAVEPGPTLREGDSGPRVDELIRRLAASADLTQQADSFDADVRAAVQGFQRRHGLEPDGAVGPVTLEALNVPVQARIDQIIVNLERWRWLPETLGERYVAVNIAAFQLTAVDAGRPVLSMRVVVGRPYRRTPVFSGTISYLVLNPDWEVPKTIAVQDELPLIKRDPGYLAEQHFTLLSGWGAEERVIDPASVDWSRVTAGNFGYRLRQAPGPNNALGRIKFMFPNEFSVYLHDTPTRALFAKESRSFSSGCIRLERPLDLAEWLLADDPAWGRVAIEQAIGRGTQQTVRLQRPTPVHLLYWTAWVDDQGELNFREDIYGRDTPVLRELREAPRR